MSEYLIHLVGGADDESGVLSTRDHEGGCRISFVYRARSIDAQADDYFEALSQIRLQLEEEGLIPFCYGASLTAR